MTLTYQDIIPLQLKINRCGYVNLTPQWNKNDGSVTSSRLYLVEEGSGYLKTATGTIFLEPGFAYLIPANYPHAYGCTKLKKIYFQFTLVSKDSADVLSAVNQICRIRYEKNDLNTLLSLYEATDLVSVITVQQTILKLICAILQQNNVPDIAMHHQAPLVEKAIAYIQKNLRISLTTKEICNHLFVSEGNLRTAFLAETGTTIGQYIDKQVMLRSRQMLAMQRCSIGEISAKLGFCDQFYFSRRFKEMHNMTPSAYRKSLPKSIK